MGKKGRSEKAQPNLEAFINDGKKTLMPALMIATFFPVLVTSLDKRQKGFDLAIDNFCTVRGATKPADDLDYEQQPKVEVDVTELWRMKPSAIAERIGSDIFEAIK